MVLPSMRRRTNKPGSRDHGHGVSPGGIPEDFASSIEALISSDDPLPETAAPVEVAPADPVIPQVFEPMVIDALDAPQVSIEEPVLVDEPIEDPILEPNVPDLPEVDDFEAALDDLVTSADPVAPPAPIDANDPFASLADPPALSDAIISDPDFAIDDIMFEEARVDASAPSFDEPEFDSESDELPIEIDSSNSDADKSSSWKLFGKRDEPEDIDLPQEIRPDDREGIENEQAGGERFYVAARRGMLAGPKALSIISNMDDDTDELNMALSAFSEMTPGQMGFIRFSAREWDGFRSHSQSWLNAKKGVGEDPDAAAKKPHQKAAAWLTYGFRRLWFEVNKENPSAFGGRSQPTPPGGNKGSVKPLTAAQVNDEEKQAWRDAEIKARDTVHFEVALRIGVIGSPEDKNDLERTAEEVAAGFVAYTTPHQQIVFTEAQPFDALTGYMGYKRGNIDMALSADELGELARVPDDLTRPHGVNVKRSAFKQLPLRQAVFIEDAYNPPKGMIPIGIANPHSEDEKIIAMPNAVLDHHAYWAGATGSGKTELMKWFAFGVAKAEYPFVVIDPHGALSEDLINALIVNCPERANDLVFCDLSDDEYPVALNPLDIKHRNSLEPTVNSVVEMLAKQMNLSAANAPRATNLARQVIMALCEANLAIQDPETKCTLLDVVPFFLDQEFRQMVIQFSKTVAVTETFNADTGVFEMMNEKQQADYAMPIIRAFQPLSSSSSFAAVFSAGENRLDFAKLIAGRKIVIVKLARFSHQAALGEFVGSLILPWLLSSMDDWGRRKVSKTGEYIGSGCRVFVDEAPAILGPESSAIQLLAEARKWDLGLIFVSQYLTGQLDPSVIKATLANTASKISLRLEPDSARLLAQSISGTSNAVTGGDVADLPPYYYYANVMIKGEGGRLDTTGPFSAACLPPIKDKLTKKHEEIRDMVIARSRKLVCNDRAFIEEKQADGKGRKDIKIALAHLIRLKLSEESEKKESIVQMDLTDDDDDTSFKDTDFTLN